MARKSRSLKRGVIMDYLGAQGVPISINSIPVHDNVDFYFLLAFAIDSDPTGKPQNGVFSPYWAETLTPGAVLKSKERSQECDELEWMEHLHKQRQRKGLIQRTRSSGWTLENAVNSITSSVKEYHLDGIDIDYETIPGMSRQFAPLIGELITTVSQSGPITVATVDPYTQTDQNIADLFKDFPSVIDYVLYQLYTEIGTKPAEMVARYNDLAKTYTYEQLIPGYEVNGFGLQGANFTTALQMIHKHPLNGVMIYSADKDMKAVSSLRRSSKICSDSIYNARRETRLPPPDLAG